MKRIIMGVAALLGMASAANAASVTVAADQAIYTVGDTITLTVTVSSDPVTESSTQAFGEITLSSGNGGSVSGSGPAVQTALTSFGGGLPWTIGGNVLCSNTACIMFNQLLGVTAFPASNTPLAIGVVQYTAATPGTVNVGFTAVTFDYFLAPLPAGTSFDIVPIPEPTTAAMLGLGILGLTLAGRRRA